MDSEKKLLSLLKAGSELHRNDILLKELDRNVKQMQQFSSNMEKENFRIEKKISTLKEKLKKERDERERTTGPRWKSSDVSIKSSEKKVNKNQKVFKVLSDQPLDNYREIKAKSSTFKLCGQCEHRRAKVECNECGENYCSVCYKEFHSKGALKKHTWTSLSLNTTKSSGSRKVDSSRSPSDQTKNHEPMATSVQDIAVSGIPAPKTPKPGLLPSGRTSAQFKQGDSIEFSIDPAWLENSSRVAESMLKNDEKSLAYPYLSPKEEKHNAKTGVEDIDTPQSSSTDTGTLLDGTYDEEANALAFKQALYEWRNGGDSHRKNLYKKKETHSTSVGTEKHDAYGVQVKFSSHSSLTYLDQILLKRCKQNPTFFQNEIEKLLKRNSVKNEMTNNDVMQYVNHIGVQVKHGLSNWLSQPKTESDFVVNIGISPYEGNELNDNMIESDIEPIISMDDEYGDVNVASVVRDIDAEVGQAFMKDRSLTDGDANSQCGGVEEQQEFSEKYLLNRTRPKYNNMDEFFLLGVQTKPKICILDNCTEASKSSESAANDQPHVVECYRSAWYPEDSQVSSEFLGGDLKVKARRKSYDHQATTSSYYDYLLASPPFSKGEDYYKVHRCSTSLTISALPPDIWLDSKPPSRRSSEEFTAEFE